MPKSKTAAKKAKKVSTKKMSKKSAPASKGIKKPRVGRVKKDGSRGKAMRFKAGTVALREIKRYQRSTKNMLPRAPFQRLVRQVAAGCNNELRF
jgi:histone H3